MYKITIGVEGMACAMCEAHINEAVRKAFPVKKVQASRHKKLAEIVTEEAIEESALQAVIDSTGYRMTSYKAELWEKKGLFHK